MSISVKKDTKFPNASIALAQFFTNPRSMVEFAKIVAIYPSTRRRLRRSVLLGRARRRSKTAPGRSPRTSSPPTQTSSRRSPRRPTSTTIVLKAIESALFNDVSAQKALTDAVQEANALIK